MLHTFAVSQFGSNKIYVIKNKYVPYAWIKPRKLYCTALNHGHNDGLDHGLESLKQPWETFCTTYRLLILALPYGHLRLSVTWVYYFFLSTMPSQVVRIGIHSSVQMT